LSTCILFWVCDDVSLNVGSIGCVVGDISNGIGRGIGCMVSWSISYGVSWSISYNISSGISRGSLAATSVERAFRSTPGVGTCYGSTVSRTSFFDLGGGNTNVGLETSDRWRIFEVV
jgi:hypothetical protein